MQFKNKDVEKDFRKKVEHIKALIDAPVDDSKYLWDETAKKYAVKIEQIQRVLRDRTMKDEMSKDLKNLCVDLDMFLNQCSNPEFHIALVGTIKAGKSTLINALLDYELASTRVTPETAALTKFKRANEDFAEITFYNEDEWEQLWKSAQDSSQRMKNSVFIEEYNTHHADQEKEKWVGQPIKRIFCKDKEELKSEIEHWTSSKSPAHYFVKEVLVGLKDFALPSGVVLVDTPGLDDVVEFRSNITRSYINRANAVLMCVKSDALTGGELRTCIQVFTHARNNVEKIYIVATQLDTLNRPVKDWEAQSIEWTKYLKGNSCFRSASLARQNLIPVSAYLYTLMEAYKANRLSEDDDRYAYELLPTLLKMRIKVSEINERFNEIEDFTNIKMLESKLQNEIVSKHKEILLQDISLSYERYMEDIQKIMKQKKDEQEKLIQDSQQNIDAIRSQKEEYTKKLEQAQEDKRELSAFIKQMKAVTAKRIEQVESALRRTL